MSNPHYVHCVAFLAFVFGDVPLTDALEFTALDQREWIAPGSPQVDSFLAEHPDAKVSLTTGNLAIVGFIDSASHGLPRTLQPSAALRVFKNHTNYFRRGVNLWLFDKPLALDDHRRGKLLELCDANGIGGDGTTPIASVGHWRRYWRGGTGAKYGVDHVIESLAKHALADELSRDPCNVGEGDWAEELPSEEAPSFLPASEIKQGRRF